LDGNGFGVFQRRELAASFKRRVLLGSGLLWRAKAFPGGEGIAVVVVDAEVFKLELAIGNRQVAQKEFYRGVGAGDIVIVIVPDEDAEFFLVETGERGHFRFGAHALF